MVPWWNKRLSGLRAKTRKLLKLAKRIGQRNNYKRPSTVTMKKIRKSKQSSWRGYCQEMNDVPGGTRLMMIMVQQTTNKVSTIKLPDCQHTQTGKETLKELFSFHVPDSKLIDESGDGQGQQNQGICGSITSRGD
jgi:hypothetical protein